MLPVTITLATFLAAALPSSETIALSAIFSVSPLRVPRSTTGLTVLGYLALPSELPKYALSIFPSSYQCTNQLPRPLFERINFCVEGSFLVIEATSSPAAVVSLFSAPVPATLSKNDAPFVTAVVALPVGHNHRPPPILVAVFSVTSVLPIFNTYGTDAT